MKKTISALLLLAALLLTACGGNGATTDGKNSSDPANSSTPAASTSGADNTDPDTTTTPAATDPTNPGTSEPGDEPMFTDDEVDIFVVKGSPEVDGVKDEIWNNAHTVTLENVIKDNPSTDTVVKASAMWDENAIYFLFEITDASIFQGGSIGDYNNDGIYLYIAEDIDIIVGSDSDYGYGVYQFALISPELEMLPRRNEDGNDLKAKTAYTRTTDGMIIEFSYSFTTGELANNRFIALDYQYNDCDESSSRLGALNYYASRVDGGWGTSQMAIAKLCETMPE